MWHHDVALCNVACNSSHVHDLLCQCSGNWDRGLLHVGPQMETASVSDGTCVHGAGMRGRTFFSQVGHPSDIPKIAQPTIFLRPSSPTSKVGVSATCAVHLGPKTLLQRRRPLRQAIKPANSPRPSPAPGLLLAGLELHTLKTGHASLTIHFKQLPSCLQGSRHVFPPACWGLGPWHPCYV